MIVVRDDLRRLLRALPIVHVCLALMIVGVLTVQVIGSPSDIRAFLNVRHWLAFFTHPVFLGLYATVIAITLGYFFKSRKR